MSPAGRLTAFGACWLVMVGLFSVSKYMGLVMLACVKLRSLINEGCAVLSNTNLPSIAAASPFAALACTFFVCRPVMADLAFNLN